VLLPDGHPLAAHERIALADLLDERLVLLDAPPSRDYFLSLFKDVGEPRLGYRAQSFEMVRGMVAHGLGYSLLATRPASSMSYDGKALVTRPVARPGQVRPDGVVPAARRRARSGHIAVSRALHRHSQGGGGVMAASRSPRLRFTLRQLEYLVAVGEAGTIAEAAHRLNVSSPSISAAISQLEAEFGVQLFVRKPAHGLSLSAAGRLFLNEAKLLLRQGHNLYNVAHELQHELSGTLSVGCMVTLAPVMAPELCKSFMDAHPGVTHRAA
jgi:DNA-binding transcriptional LysR family regulator